MDQLANETTNETAKKTKIGLVVSDKMDKTVVILTERKIKHPVVKKYIKVHKKFFAHDEDNSCAAGDRVEIVECRPLSAKKRWKISKVVSKSK